MLYVKTHKTGSTTVAHHLLRYLKRHRLRPLSAPGHIYIDSVNTDARRRADAVVAHHMAFNRTVYESYLRREPELVLTSIRLPLQRQLSWFRQQNRQFERLPLHNCTARNEHLLAFYDGWKAKKAGAQWTTLREARRADELGRDMEAIVAQFSFVLIKERMKESFECMCMKTGVRLCGRGDEMRRMNVREKDACVERQLVAWRYADLIKGDELDLLLYEIAGRKLSECGEVSQACRCPVAE